MLRHYTELSRLNANPPGADKMGVEPMTSKLTAWRSTTELLARIGEVGLEPTAFR